MRKSPCENQNRFFQLHPIKHHFFILLTCLFLSLLGTVDASRADTFKTVNGECVIEAENWTRRGGTVGGQWRVQSSNSGYKGSGYARGGLDDSVKMTNGLSSNYARIEFDIDFKETGRYYVHFRSYAIDHTENGFYATLNGSEINYGHADAEYIYVRKMSNWYWYTRGYAHEQHIYPVSFNVTSTGVKKFAVHRRDPGSRLDRIWLTKATSGVQSVNSLNLPSASNFIVGGGGGEDPPPEDPPAEDPPPEDPPAEDPPPADPTENNCSDGNDNDDDNLVDCEDPDCSGASACDGTSDADISIYDSNGNAWDLTMDYPEIVSGQTDDEKIVITNRGTTDLQIINIAVTDPLEDPFSITTNPCSATTLSPGDECTVRIRFAPTAPGDYSDSFEVESDDPNDPVETIVLTAIATLSPAGDITVSDNSGASDDRSVNFGEIETGQTAATSVTISNEGTADLSLNDIATADPLAGPFSIADDPCASATLSPGSSCTVQLRFSPSEPGSFADSFEIQSSDPDEGTLVVTLNGIGIDLSTGADSSGDDDNDSVDDAEEDGVADNGDGNGDGTPDRLQDNVTSMLTLTGDYVTLEAPAGSKLANCQINESPSPDDAPSDVNFSQGLFEFTITDLVNPDDITIKIILHSDDVPSSYYKYGPTPDNPSDHWYQFNFDNTTGAEIDGNVITLHFVDAERGDDVLTPDNMIVDIGGPAYQKSSSDNGICFISSLF